MCLKVPKGMDRGLAVMPLGRIVSVLFDRLWPSLSSQLLPWTMSRMQVMIFVTGVVPTSPVRIIFVLAGPCQYIGKALKSSVKCL